MKLIKIKTNSEIQDLILYDENDCFIEKYNSKRSFIYDESIKKVEELNNYKALNK